MLWRTFMPYFVLCCNGEESFNTFFLIPNPDPDPGGSSHRDNTTCVKNQVNRSDSFSVTRPEKHTEKQTQMHLPRICRHFRDKL